VRSASIQAAELAEAYATRGSVLLDQQRPEEALQNYDRAIALQPGLVGAHFDRALALMLLHRPLEALASYDCVLALAPAQATAHSNRGHVLCNLERFTEALDSCDRAIALQSELVGAHAVRGNALRELGRHEEALESYARALKIEPGWAFLRGLCLETRMRICDWDGLEEQLRHLREAIARGERVVEPFTVLGLVDSLSLQRQAAETWMQWQCPPNPTLGAPARRAPRERIRLGYFSGDFREHAVATLIAAVFGAHDRSRFEVSGFSFGLDTGGPMRRRLEGAFERFIDVRHRSDLEVAQLARQLELDIAVDLGGFTAGGRPGIFALRVAPLQVNYLGYPGTLAVPYIDYIIADKVVIPPAARASYAESVAYLPHCYLPPGDRRAIDGGQQSRADHGLPAEGFVFCCFNAHYKIMPDCFDRWMRLLQVIEDSVLWLKKGSDAAMRNLRQRAARRAIASERIVFAAQMPRLEDHLARHALADLFLDTLPYNAHTTAVDAIWAGLPVLTCAGESFAARAGASLLQSAGVPELITASPQRYEELAIELARDPQRLAALRHRLAARCGDAALFDVALFTRHLESAYSTMYERYLAGSRLEPIYCADLSSNARTSMSTAERPA
jgi:predicted O-linked N-acetylglucosamine transferase (SPINDLY family)